MCLRFSVRGQVLQTVSSSGHTMSRAFVLLQVCRQMFQSSDRMWSHRLVFHDQIETTKCDKCSFSTDSQSELENHALLNHGQFTSQSELENHALLNHGQFTSQSELENHALLNHGQFTSQSELENHALLNHGQFTSVSCPLKPIRVQSFSRL